MKDTNLQDVFLEQAQRLSVSMTLNLTSGFQVKGTVVGFDSFTIIMDSDERQSLIYKHAVASVVPAKPIKFNLQPTPTRD